MGCPIPTPVPRTTLRAVSCLPSSPIKIRSIVIRTCPEVIRSPCLYPGQHLGQWPASPLLPEVRFSIKHLKSILITHQPSSHNHSVDRSSCAQTLLFCDFFGNPLHMQLSLLIIGGSSDGHAMDASDYNHHSPTSSPFSDDLPCPSTNSAMETSLSNRTRSPFVTEPSGLFIYIDLWVMDPNQTDSSNQL